MPERRVLDYREISEVSKQFMLALFERFPHLQAHAAMERNDRAGTWDPVVTVVPPSGDSRAELVIWVDGGDDPSLAFGRWHTHEDVWALTGPASDARAALLDLVADIFAERYVLCEDVGIESPFEELLDMAKEDAVLDYLTESHSPNRVCLRSWSGQLDREVALADLADDA